jgi:imidazolonepropionase-like amidohydrolase
MVVDNLPDELIQRMVEADVYWVPTLELWQGVSRVNPVDFITKATENLGRFVEAGGKVALGTDYAGYQTEFDLGTPLHEVDGMLEAGMTPLQIIVAATKHAAHVCNLAGEIGTLEAGKVADVLVVDGDPLDDIGVLANIQMILRDGVII